MEPITTLKRTTPLSLNLCIICQSEKIDEKLLNSSQIGIDKIFDCTTQRHKLRDQTYTDTIDRLLKLVNLPSNESLVWHKNCYASYTSLEKIQRLRKANEKLLHSKPRMASSRRSNSQPINWLQCIFCQSFCEKSKLSNVSTFNMNTNILKLSLCDPIMTVRLAGVEDLIAFEAKYHLPCFVKFTRKATVSSKNCIDSEIVMSLLCEELKVAADHGHMLELSEVWQRYCTISANHNVDIPVSFKSRITTFKNKLKTYVEQYYEAIVLNDKDPREKCTVLFPVNLRDMPVSMLKESIEEDDPPTFTVYKPQDEDEFLSMAHVAFKLRGDVLAHKMFEGVDVSRDAAISCVPDSLYMFINLLLGGAELLGGEPENDEDNESLKSCRILSIAQDIIYSIHRGQKLTPKHLGLGSTIHQATRSKQLVEMLHKAGHIASYKQILKLDTSLADKTISTMHPNGSVLPPNLHINRFVHFSTDNIDINEASLDGKNSFHATQVAAWQRGPPPSNILSGIKLSHKVTLNVPEAMNTIIPPILTTSSNPYIDSDIKLEWFNTKDDISALQAKAKDLAFVMVRHEQHPKQTWTAFNQQHTTVNPEKTSVGYLPIIQAPAHEIDTLNTVVQRVKYIADSVGIEYIVLGVDEALYGKLMDLKYKVAQYRNILFPRLGGLHTGLNFQGILGAHMKDCGLVDVWVESELLGANAANQVMAGKSYARANRAHKLTFQALWQILLPQFYEYLEQEDSELKNLIHSKITPDGTITLDTIVEILTEGSFQGHLKLFVERLIDSNPTNEFWWNYMEMVNTLLMFIRAQRDGLWSLHLYSFRKMLPFMFHYNHTNYARWGAVYLAEMNQLPQEILDEFKAGNFVVKDSDNKFNQVDPDHSQEWMNAVGKKSGGIVGITRTTSALSRWSLSYNFRANISAQTRELLLSGYENEFNQKEASPSRMKRDDDDEQKIVNVLKRFHVFDDKETSLSKVLHNIATKDVATDDIQASLLGAGNLGQVKLNQFVENRLVSPIGQAPKVAINATLHKTKVLTFSSLYEVAVSKTFGKQKTIKVDRSILQRLITAYKAGRQVDLDKILKHELMPVPISLAGMDGKLHSSGKSKLAEVLTEGIATPAQLQLRTRNTLIIDGQALVMGIGKPKEQNFGEFAEAFLKTVLTMGLSFDRIDIVFDRYIKHSIKEGTRVKRTKFSHPIRRVIEDTSVPLPNDWSRFISLAENKENLAEFLCDYVIAHAPANKTIITAGGFKDIKHAKSNKADLNITLLEANHEEADTRLVLHSIHTEADCIVVSCRDTDVLVLLTAYFGRINCNYLWMKAGTISKPKYIPVHDIHQKLSDSQINGLLAFHTLTGCDSVPHLSGHSKKTEWKVFEMYSDLLLQLGNNDLSDETIKAAESFICKIYNVTDVDSCDKARSILFCKGRTQESLPPTSDAAQLHIRRAHYQTVVWKQSHQSMQELPQVTNMGWKISNDELMPLLMTLPPIPDVCSEIISCGCTKGCLSRRCSCKKINLNCTDACKCSDTPGGCRNMPS